MFPFVRAIGRHTGSQRPSPVEVEAYLTLTRFDQADGFRGTIGMPYSCRGYWSTVCLARTVNGGVRIAGRCITILDKAAADKLEEALGALNSQASSDCYDNGTGDKCYCATCEARRAVSLIESVLEPEHTSLQRSRLTNPAEMIYHEEWIKAQEKHPGLNSGFGTLEWVLCPEGQEFPGRPSQRDATVAASIIQWLGTNCGRGFVDKCEKRIAAENAKRSDFERGKLNCDIDESVLSPLASIASFRSIAEMIADTHHPNVGKTVGLRNRLIDEIEHAMRLAASGRVLERRMMPAKTCLLAGV